MNDLIVNASLSDVNYDNNVKLINNIFTDQSFYYGMRKFSIHINFFDNTINKLASSSILEKISIEQFSNCFILVIT